MNAPPVVPRPAATTLIVRDGDDGVEVLMVRRSPSASFMPGAYVFPGGAVDAADGAEPALARLDEPAAALQRRIGTVTHVGDAAAAFAVAALRETFEECGLWLGIDTLPDAARWRARVAEPLAATRAPPSSAPARSRPAPAGSTRLPPR